jgi:hypothetical protein
MQIQRETGIRRNIARREYEDWERSQALGELKEARKVVAAEAFRDHINHIIQIAESLSGHLRTPSFGDRNTSADDFLDGLWKTSIISPSGTSATVDEGRSLRENHMLFKSLKEHTRDKIQWQDLDEWKRPWNESVALMQSLYEGAIGIINPFLTERLMPKIEKDTRRKQPVERMAGAVITQIVRWIENNKLELLWERNEEREPQGGQNEEREGIVTRLWRTGSDIQLVFADSYQPILTFSNTKADLAEMTQRACNLVAMDFRLKEWRDKAESLRDGIGTAKKLKEKFNEVLDPLVLRPLILRTRCELCPA